MLSMTLPPATGGWVMFVLKRRKVAGWIPVPGGSLPVAMLLHQPRSALPGTLPKKVSSTVDGIDLGHCAGLHPAGALTKSAFHSSTSLQIDAVRYLLQFCV
jgi:hypothetical protein